MDELDREIARLQESIDLYNAVISYADKASRQTFLGHRDWDVSILADLRHFPFQIMCPSCAQEQMETDRNPAGIFAASCNTFGI